jgi:hypothetical protein
MLPVQLLSLWARWTAWSRRRLARAMSIMGAIEKGRRPKPPPVSLSCSEGLQVGEKLEDSFRAVISDIFYAAVPCQHPRLDRKVRYRSLLSSDNFIDDIFNGIIGSINHSFDPSAGGVAVSAVGPGKFPSVNAAIFLWPRLRASPKDGAPIIKISKHNREWTRSATHNPDLAGNMFPVDESEMQWTQR